MTKVPSTRQSCCVCGGKDHKLVAQGTDWQYKTTDDSYDWLCCDTCGHYYLSRVTTPEAIHLIYPSDLKNYEEFDEKPGLAFRVKSYLDGRSIRKLTQSLPQGSRLLDVGCAGGMYLDSVKKYCPNITQLEGVEISKDAARSAVRKGYEVHIGLIEDLDLPEGGYDVIVMQQVIEHVHDPEGVLRKMCKALKPGGMLIAETPNLFSFDHRFFRRGFWEGYHFPRHFNLWTNDGMLKLCSQAGFTKTDYQLKIKPVHWTLSIQNWTIDKGYGPSIVRFFDMRNPLLLMFFGVVDVLQLALFKKASDVRYIARK